MWIFTISVFCLVCLLMKVDKVEARFRGPYIVTNYVEEIEEQEMKKAEVKGDEDLTVPQLVTKNGYPIEIHHVTTKDGYILELHRIPYGRKSGPGPNKPAIYLQHGFIASSADWIMNIVEKALAYELADRGYDVFMGNARGNTYSRKHTKLTPNCKEFWDFSFHQMGIYDIPAVIDYVLKVSGQKNLYYVGHSMGTAMFWITMSQNNPDYDYNSKIRLMIALAPVAYVANIRSPIRKFSGFATDAEFFFYLFGDREFLPSRGIITLFRKVFCDHEIVEQAICENIVFLLSGFDRKQLNETMLPVILGHTPAGASTHTLIHFAQGIDSGKFRQFDYGKCANLERYGQAEPPEYNLTKVTAPVALFYGDNDLLADTKDVMHLESQLKNVVLTYRVEDPQFSHLDFLFAIDSNKLVYNKVFELLEKY